MDPAMGKVARHVERSDLLPPGGRVLAAFSGGADSAALVIALRDLGYDVVLGHVDHGMRPGSSADAAHCRRVAAALGLPIAVACVHVAPPTEAQARRVRYDALDRLADAAVAPVIATGHTLDDQAETVLLRLARGGFPLGMPVRRGRVVRPLLSLRRDETERLCRDAQVPHLSDPSNADERLARNFIRRRVLAGVRPDVVERVARLGDLAGTWATSRAAEAESLLAEIAEESAGEIRLDRRRLAVLPQTRARSVLRAALARAGIAPGSALVADLLRKVTRSTGARLDLPGGLAAWCEPLHVVIGPLPIPAALPLVHLAPGRTESPAWGVAIVVEPLRTPRPPQGGHEAVLDAVVLNAPLVLRARAPGDRMRPAGGPGTRKVQDVLVDLKVPRHLRDRVPVLTVAGQPAWIPGYRIDERFRPTASDGPAVSVRLFPLLRPAGKGRSMPRFRWPLPGLSGLPSLDL